MDCDSCGRHRPSPEIGPAVERHGHLLMVCARCRRVLEAKRRPTPTEPAVEVRRTAA